jgi:hypothetical protein
LIGKLTNMFFGSRLVHVVLSWARLLRCCVGHSIHAAAK